MKDKNFFLTLPFLLFFVSPIFILFYYFNFSASMPLQDLALAIKNSCIQSLSAAFVCTVVALALAKGLSKSSHKSVKWLLQLSLLPSLLPSLFTILIVFSYFKQFPFGHLGVILIFSTTYLGFATVALAQAYRARVLQYVDLIKLYNISIRQRVFKIYLPLLAKDIFNVFLIITLGCFSSLAVPLLAGGGRSTNVEVFIYETIFINGQWGAAVYMALAQLGILFLMSLCLEGRNDLARHEVVNGNKAKVWNLSFIVLGMYVVSYILGYFIQVIRALQPAILSSFNWSDFVSPLGRSFALAFFSIMLFLFLVSSFIYFSYRKISHRFLFYFMLPSSTLVGFAAYLIFPESTSNWLDILKVSLCFNVVYSLALYKSYIYPMISQLESQFSVARIYGLSFFKITQYVVFPQIKSVIWISINILFLFSFCEFALIKAAGTQNVFTGVFIERLISNYRLELGFLYSFVVLINSALFFKATEFLNVEN